MARWVRCIGFVMSVSLPHAIDIGLTNKSRRCQALPVQQVDCQGIDAGPPQKLLDYGSCCALCEKVPSCRAFSYSEGLCRLKESCLHLVSSDAHSSGQLPWRMRADMERSIKNANDSAIGVSMEVGGLLTRRRSTTTTAALSRRRCIRRRRSMSTTAPMRRRTRRRRTTTTSAPTRRRRTRRRRSTTTAAPTRRRRTRRRRSTTTLAPTPRRRTTTRRRRSHRWSMKCPATLRKDSECYGEDIAKQSAPGPGTCCEICSETDGCKAFTYRSGTCYLKSGCNSIIQTAGATHGIIDSYTVHMGHYYIKHSYQCGDQSKKTLIFYPSGSGPFNVVVYAHGRDGGIDGAYDALRTVAGTGLVVIAPFTQGSNEKCLNEWEDVVLALKAAKIGGASYHKALANIDWSRTGVWGYSMGGKRIPKASEMAIGVHAMLASHGARKTYNVTVPSMFTTGTADTLEGPTVIQPQFDHCPAQPKIYVNLKGADHTEPIKPGRLNIWGGRFLSCHVALRDRHCHAIYGKGEGTLCQAHDYADCIVVRSKDSALDLEFMQNEMDKADPSVGEIMV